MRNLVFSGQALSCYQCGPDPPEEVMCKQDPDPNNLKECPEDRNQYCVYASASASMLHLFNFIY